MNNHSRLWLVVVLLSVLVSSTSIAAQLSAREWDNDTKALTSNVLEPLREQFKGQDCIEDAGQNVVAFLNALSETRPTIDPRSYLLFREIGVAIGEELLRFEDQMTCAVVDRWTVVNHYIERKLEFLGNVFAILYKAKLTTRAWTNDTKAFNSQVLEPLTAELKGQECIEDVGQYIVILLDKLPDIRATVGSKSYLLFREAIVATAEELGQFEEELTCAVVDRWIIIKHHIERKIEFLGNVFAILD